MPKNNNREWVRKYFSLILSSKSDTPKILSVSRNLKMRHLKDIKHLYVYRNVDFIKKYFIPMLNSQQIIETKLSNPLYFEDTNDCRMPLEYYKHIYPRESHIVELWSYFIERYPTNNCYAPNYYNELNQTLIIDSDDDWGKKVLEITSNYFLGFNEYAPDEFRKFVQRPWDKLNDKDLERIGVRCFTEDLYSKKLWEKHGDYCRGICLEYDVEPFLRLYEGKDCLNYLYPVLYSDDIHDRVIDALNDSYSTLTSDDINKQIKQSLLVKNTSYEWEVEWRFVMIFKELSTDLKEILSNDKIEYYNNRVMPFPLSCIYLGSKIDSELEAEICNAIRIHNDSKIYKEIIIKKMS